MHAHPSSPPRSISRRFRRFAAVALAIGGATGAGGCALAVQDEGESDGVEPATTEDDALNVTHTAIWGKLSIPVCWESPSDASSTRRGWVKDQITNSWQKSSQVRFTGWGTCSTSSSGLRLRIADETASTGLLVGDQLDGVKNGVTLNLNMRAPQSYVDCAARFGQEACVRSTSMHEFGHALGFEHEQMRLDNPDFDCFALLGGGLGDTWVGDYDKSSIMRSCTVADSVRTTLSSTDKLGLQAYYGNPAPEGVKKAAVGWDDENFYFFFGKNVSLYSVSADMTAKYFPKATAKTFGNWPTTSPWTSGVDAVADYSSTKLYFFSGSQYAKYDKATNRIESGYPRSLPGGWTNWPSSWTSVDAAVRWSNGKIYLFRGSEYLRLTGTTVDSGYPQPIDGHWNIPYTSGFDYGFIYPGGKAYFFKGPEYIRVSIDGDQEKVDSGYPKAIVGRWPGVTF